MTERIKNVVCVANLKDIHCWIHTSYAVPDHIAAERYVLVSPERYVSVFKSVGNPAFEVISENLVAPEYDLSYVSARMPEHNRTRAGWYYQQLLKISALLWLQSNPDDVLLIWDADAIPLIDLNFIQGGRLIYFRSSENHRPYFDTIRNLLGLEKCVDFSFVSQCFPIVSQQLVEFITFVESRSGGRWYDAILNSADLSQPCGFSEYETLGTFLANTHPSSISTEHIAWERFGKRVCPIERSEVELAKTNLAFVCYESWDSADISVAKLALPGPKNESEFLDLFFNRMTGSRAIIQIGANDGVMEDPIYHHLRNTAHNEVVSVLIEPLDYYFQKLTRLHTARPNTMMIKAAAGSSETTRKFYYIAPEIAAEMNGDGPPNNWAHGQGSFLRSSVEYWIWQNQFRGEIYRANIGKYLGAIRETDVNVVPLRCLSLGGIENVLLIIDVQGAELEVLLGVNWRRRPQWLVFEQDLGEQLIIRDLLTALGYYYICGKSNVVWGLVDANVGFVE